eukprot:1161671-Pelagomonas_calceolata.AAC.4
MALLQQVGQSAPIRSLPGSTCSCVPYPWIRPLFGCLLIKKHMGVTMKQRNPLFPAHLTLDTCPPASRPRVPAGQTGGAQAHQPSAAGRWACSCSGWQHTGTPSAAGTSLMPAQEPAKSENRVTAFPGTSGLCRRQMAHMHETGNFWFGACCKPMRA